VVLREQGLPPVERLGQLTAAASRFSRTGLRKGPGGIGVRLSAGDRVPACSRPGGFGLDGRLPRPDGVLPRWTLTAAAFALCL